MTLDCNTALPEHVRGATQVVRVITERWFAGFGYCLACQSEVLTPTRANTRACDFLCPSCAAPYELKSSAKILGARVVDGEYKTMMGKIAAGTAPTLMLLQYAPGWKIENLVALHSVFLTPAIVEARNPLGPTARRAGWQGCNLRVDRVPPDGRIALVRGGVVSEKAEVRRQFELSARFGDLPLARRGWAGLVLAAVRKIGKAEFTLAEVYAFKETMHAVYPGNSHVRDKIRQQMQVLRDLGYVEFVGRGSYRARGN